MNCLQGYIGIRGCADSEPESGLYINDLPGISLESLDKIANSEQITYAKVFEDIERRALRRFSTLVNNWLSLRYQIKNLKQSANFGSNVENTTTIAAAKYRGFVVWLSDSELYVKSNLHYIHIQSLKLYLGAAVNTSIKVYDILERTGDSIVIEQLNSFPVTGAVGWNTVRVNEDFQPTLGLLIVYNSTGILSRNFEIPEQINDYCGCACECFGCELKIEGVETDDLNIDSITRGVNTYGLSGVLSIGCRFDQFICDNRQNFAVALWYLYGYEYWYERIYTDRLNRFGTIDRQKAIEARNEFWKIFNEEMETALSGVEIKQDCCIECNAQVKAVPAML